MVKKKKKEMDEKSDLSFRLRDVLPNTWFHTTKVSISLIL